MNIYTINNIIKVFLILGLLLIQNINASDNLSLAKYGSSADKIKIKKDIKGGYGEHFLELTHPSSVVIDSLKPEFFRINIYGGHNHSIEWSLNHPKLGNVGEELLLPFFSLENKTDAIHINHTAILPKYITEEPYTLSIDVFACDVVGCTDKKKISTTLQIYILAGADAESFNIPSISVDTLFYIDSNDKFKISGLEHIQDIVSATNKISNLNVDTLRQDIRNANKNLGEVIIGLTDILTNDLTSIYDTKKQQELHFDQNLLIFLASKELDKITTEDINQIASVLDKYKQDLQSLKNYTSEISLPSEEIDCKNNSECKAYLHLTGDLTLKPKLKTYINLKNNIAEFRVLTEKENPFIVDFKATLGANVNIDKSWTPPRKQLVSKKLVQVYPTPVGIPVVLSQKLSIYAEVEINGTLEAGAEIEFKYNRNEVFMAGVSYNGRDFDLDGKSCTETLEGTGFKAYRCRNTKENSFKITGKIKGNATAEAILWIYPEIEFMVYRNVGASISTELGIYAKTSIDTNYTAEKDIDIIANNSETYLDANYQFKELEMGVKGQVRFRADLGLIYQKAGKEKVIGLAYPLCAGFCSRDERKILGTGSYPLLDLPKIEISQTGSIGNNLTLTSQVNAGQDIFQEDKDNDVNGYSWYLVGKAKDIFSLPLSNNIPSLPIRVSTFNQEIKVTDSSKLEIGETYTIRLIYWSEIHKVVRQVTDYPIIYNPPQGNPNLSISLSSGLNIKLNWNDVASSSEYLIYRDGVLISTISSTGDDTYEYIDTNSSIGQNYSYQIVPISSGGIQYNSPIVNYPPNESPTAKAGADKTINFNQAVTLIGNESNDSDGNIVSYEWTENGSTLSNDVNFTKNDFSIGTHTITLIVTDNDGATGSDDVVIKVLENNTTETAWLSTGVTLSRDGTKAYVADYYNGLVIVDISDPVHPTKLGSYDTAGWSCGVTLSSDGTKAYVADDDNGLVIVDISDPAHPTKLGLYDTDGDAKHVTLSSDGTKAYVADWWNGLVIVDISDPAHPTKLSLHTAPAGVTLWSDAAGVALSSDGTKAYVADHYKGLVIVDISDPVHPTKLGSYDTAGWSYGVTLSSDGTKAYVADHYNGLVIVDISNPAHPTKLGLYDTAGWSCGVTLSSDGTKAYIADDYNGLVIVDISDPAHPTKLDSYRTVGYSLDVTLSRDGTKAYVADGDNGLVIVDISDPAHPTKLGL